MRLMKFEFLPPALAMAVLLMCPHAIAGQASSPLADAAEKSDRPTIRILLKQHADLNAPQVDGKEKHGQTALMWAAAEGHTAVVELLLKAGADFRTSLADSGFTPLFFAVREGRTEVARALLKAGADVNETMQPRKTSGTGVRKGTSALILAVENGHFDLALTLLEAAADPNDQRSGFTTLHAMTWVRKPNRGDGDDGDPSPIGSGNLSSLQFVKELVAHGADVNARLRTGKSGKGILSRKGATPF